MQLKLTLSHGEPINLPIAYNYIVQSVIYHALSGDTKFQGALHDYGYTVGEKSFKLFTFGPLLGEYKIESKRIIFNSDIVLEVRSPDAYFISLLMQRLMPGERVVFANQELYVSKLEVTDNSFYANRIVAKMLSPIISYDTEDGYRRYYSPNECEFSQRAESNFYFKKASVCSSCTGNEPLKITPYRVNEKNKVVTKYKGVMMTGWKGIYVIEGAPEDLNFLYNTGIGCKNSQGFGMFEILEADYVY